MISSFEDLVFAHLIQASIVVLCTLVVVHVTYKRFPHLAFLLCMLAMAKCLVPPLVTSPTGVFTRLSSISFAPPASEFSSLDVEALTATMGSPAAAVSEAMLLNSRASVGLFPLLAAAWVLGAVTLLCITGRRWIKVHKVVCRSVPARREFREKMERLRQRLGVRREVRMLISNENFGPACVGVVRPTLVLPKSMIDSWPDRLLDPVVAHELVHVRRGDVQWGYLQYVVQVFFWFHPLVWWVGRQTQLLCERCCDKEVIASLDCKPADYGESLVRVLELRSVCRPLPMAHAMSPVEITTQRLSQLTTNKYSAGTARVAWCLTLLVGALTLPGMYWSSPLELEARKQEELAVYKEQINCAIQLEDWELAARLLQPVVSHEPQNPDAVFFLAYTLHKAGRLDEAIVFHRKAARFSCVKPLAIYNLACALALKGDDESAMQNLAAAVSAGFRPQRSLREDADLRSLFTRADFLALEANVNQPGILAKLCDAIAIGLTDSKEIEQVTVASGKPAASAPAATTARSTFNARATFVDGSATGRAKSRVEIVVRPELARPRPVRQPRVDSPARN